MFPEGGSRSNLISAESLTGGLAVSPVAAAMAIKTRTKRVGFQYLAGSTIGMLASWQAGAVGAAPRLGAAAPQACCEVWQAFKDGDEPLATEKQSRIAVVAGMVDDRTGMAGLKYACDLNSYFGGRPRLPLLPCTAAERLDLERELAGIKN
jgi:dihydrodipicolinate synthase/N-acetylneuraminate lyase